MTDKLDLPRLARDFTALEIETRLTDTGQHEITFPLSSELPVARWFGEEVLRHDAKSIRMERISQGAAPLLFNHNWDDPIGMITAGRVQGGRLVVDAKFFDTARAQEVRTMIEGGLRNVSVGYEIIEMTEDKKAQRFTATDWMPLEGSICTIPADPSVGIGRSLDGSDPTAKPVRIVQMRADSQPAQPANPKGLIMSDTPNAQAGAPADSQQLSAVDLENQRKQAITNICRANKIDERIERRWIETGADFAQVSNDLLGVLKARGESNPQSAAQLDMSAGEVRKYSVLRALRAAATNDWKNAGLELEASKAITAKTGRSPEQRGGFLVPFDILRRDVDVAGTTGSNYLVGTNNQPGNFIDLLRNRSVVFAMGATRLSGLVGNVTIPKQTAGGTAYWLADETTSITESQPTFGQLALTAKNVAALTEISEQMMRQSSPDAEQLIMGDLAKVVALAVDVAAIRGSGNTGEPHGIVGTSGVGSVSGTSLGAAGIIEFQTDIAANNALTAGCGYVTTPAIAGALMARFTNATYGEKPLWDGSVLDARMMGFRAMSSNQMASATMLFGDWSQVIVGEWGVLELATHATDFAKGLTGVRAWYTCDVGLRVPGAFSYASSIT